LGGRRPKPTALKILTGNPSKRPLNKHEPIAENFNSPCPSYLTKKGIEAWHKLTPILKDMNVLTNADSLALERLCDCYADILAARELIKRDGRTYQTTDANGNTLIKNNPAVNQARTSEAQLKSYLVEFGLTPAARTKLHSMNGDDEKEDTLSEFFG